MKSRENAHSLPMCQSPRAAALGLTNAGVFAILSHRHELAPKRDHHVQEDSHEDRPHLHWSR